MNTIHILFLVFGFAAYWFAGIYLAHNIDEETKNNGRYLVLSILLLLGGFACIIFLPVMSHKFVLFVALILISYVAAITSNAWYTWTEKTSL